MSFHVSDQWNSALAVFFNRAISLKLMVWHFGQINTFIHGEIIEQAVHRGYG